MSDFEARDFRNACGLFPTGVTIITALSPENSPHGMTANAFMSISLEPPMIAVSIANKARMQEYARSAGRFAVSVLARSMEPLAWHFAGKSSQEIADPFEYFDGLPVIVEACACFSVETVSEILAGDHTIFLGRVRRLIQRSDRPPLVFTQGRFSALSAVSQ